MDPDSPGAGSQSGAALGSCGQSMTGLISEAGPLSRTSAPAGPHLGPQLDPGRGSTRTLLGLVRSLEVKRGVAGILRVEALEPSIDDVCRWGREARDELHEVPRDSPRERTAVVYAGPH